MSFYTKLKNILKNKLTEKELVCLPRGYQIVGKILLIKLNKKLLKKRKLIGKTIIKILPYVHTVCLIKEIKKETRKPKIEVIAGCKKTQTLHQEYKCKFLLDVSDIMWSQGNKNERIKLIKTVKPKETIVDMFAGIGYFSIFLAKYCKPKKIYAIDINPEAIEYLRKNIWLNNVENNVEILQGDCRKFAKFLENTADRIIMGYLFKTEKFLPYALKIAKNNAIIHFHRTVKQEEIDKIKEKLEKKAKVRVLRTKKVKSYAPKIWHVVFDLKVIKNQSI
ncbi:MAG: methyltransferase domain-containing protein [Candidatus Aenigmarchaeota archaeon]|nr:methyltransferase domain-containing protein [Candidatus Aenigmarchaeota archaeon]